MERDRVGTNPDVRWREAFPSQPLVVEVRSALSGEWCSGFTVDEVDVREDGSEWFRLRRESDGKLLLSWFKAEDVEIRSRSEPHGTRR
ncbi:MAG TPA: hypothetical protein VFA83_19670 [Acidimicrobiales bacterium]|nr:hypothetical protein [Acidimicrobiales bacterium]